MLDRELIAAVRLAREAGKILLEVYATEFGVEMKGAADPVTEADRRANAYITAKLRESFPDDAVIAEESANTALAGRGRCWFVDPLDGTKEFISRNGEFSVMIGLVVDGEAQLGVVYQPTEDKLYRGVVGDGAFLEHGDKTWSLKPSSEAEPSALRLVVSRSHRSASTDALVKRLGITQEMPSGSVGIKVGLICERKADFYVLLAGASSVWDACAPDAILRAAGGRFTDLEGHGIDYRSPSLRNERGLLACNRAAFERVVPVVAEVARGAGLLG